MSDPKKMGRSKRKLQDQKSVASKFWRFVILGKDIEDRPSNSIERYVVLEDAPYADFVESIRPHLEGYARVTRAATNLRFGKFGKWRDVGEGVRELKIDCGEGYRIYYSLAGLHIIVLVGGGVKSDQDEDIKRSIKRWKEIESGIKKYE